MKSLFNFSSIIITVLAAASFHATQASTILVVADQLQAGQNNTFQAKYSTGPWNPPVNAPSSTGMLAVGFNNALYSSNSSAIGNLNSVWMGNSLALGQGNVVGQSISAAVNNFNSMAIGKNNWVAGSDSLVVGNANTAAYYFDYENMDGAMRSLVVGDWNYCIGHNSVIIGNNNSISSSWEWAMIPVMNSAVFGAGLISRYDNCTIVGKNNLAAYPVSDQPSPLLIVGNGVSASARSNALEVLSNGDMKLQGNIAANGVVTCAPGGDIPMFTGN